MGTNQVVSVTSIHTPSGANPDLKEFAALIRYKHTVSQHMYTNTSPLWSLERGLRIALQAMQEKKTLISR